MAVSRDQAARVLREEPVQTASAQPASMQPPEPIRDAATDEKFRIAEQPRSEVINETARRTGDAPAQSVPPPAAETAPPPKSGKRKFVLMGLGLLLAIAAASYGGYYTLIGRFYVSTDDAYVRANNTMLGARVAGHIS